jgi:hypothetical protein
MLDKDSDKGLIKVRMIHAKKARPIQNDGTLQRLLVGGLGPAPAVGRPVGQVRSGILLGQSLGP